MKKHQTHRKTSLTVGFACWTTTFVNSPYIRDSLPILQGNGTDPGTQNRDVPSDNRDCLRIITLTVAYLLLSI